MASEYLKWKYKDVQPREHRQLTPAEKRKNWWHYHKWHVAAGIVLAGIAVSWVCNALGVGQTKPDYQIAYVGKNILPDDTAAAIESAFAASGEDLNGDGKVTVRLNQYPSGGGDPQLTASAEVSLMADILERDSYFFLLEDPAAFQRNYKTLRRLDGTLPEESDVSGDGTWLRWTDCPVLAERELGPYRYQALGRTVTGDSGELAAKLCLARRGFWTEETCAHAEGCDALWARLTEGAVT